MSAEKRDILSALPVGDARTMAWLAGMVPRQSAAGSRIALATYRLLTQTGRVSPEEIARAAGTGANAVVAQLDDWPAVQRDDSGAVTGFWGLTALPTGHRLKIADLERFAWCAWDTLFLPELIGETAEVVSKTPVDGHAVRLSVSAAGVQVLEPVNTPLFLCFNLPDEVLWRADVVTNFCQHVHFLTEGEAARWCAAHPQAVLLTLADAFRAGQMRNRTRFAGLPAVA